MIGKRFLLAAIALLMVILLVGQVYAETLTYTVSLDAPVVAVTIAGNKLTQGAVVSNLYNMEFGDGITVNTSGSNVYIGLSGKIDSVPAGLTLVTGSTVAANQVKITTTYGNESAVPLSLTSGSLTLSSIAPNTTATLNLRIIIGAGTAAGSYQFPITITAYQR